MSSNFEREQRIRDVYVSTRAQQKLLKFPNENSAAAYREYERIFTEWLTAVKAEAWDEGVGACLDDSDMEQFPPPNPYRAAS